MQFRMKYFNSSMVRLRVYINRQKPIQLPIFQFQYGTIKSIKTADPKKVIKRFQFQYGTIKRGLSMEVSMDLTIFQFQYGTIKSGA